VIIKRQWANGDVVKLQLPMRLTGKTWDKNHHAVSVNFGPLSFSLKIDERWSRFGSNPTWPEFEVFPSTPWNYGLVLNNRTADASFKIVRKPMGPAADPFTQAGTPIEIRAPAKRIPAWQIDSDGLAGKLQDSPVKSDEPTETITLIPMGAARLRISMFPVVGHGSDAVDWKPPTMAGSQ
jgi:hypothetical protein